jgi:hypothetical protein
MVYRLAPSRIRWSFAARRDKAADFPKIDSFSTVTAWLDGQKASKTDQKAFAALRPSELKTKNDESL